MAYCFCKKGSTLRLHKYLKDHVSSKSLRFFVFDSTFDRLKSLTVVLSTNIVNSICDMMENCNFNHDQIGMFGI